jgi:hypothetical protein
VGAVSVGAVLVGSADGADVGAVVPVGAAFDDGRSGGGEAGDPVGPAVQPVTARASVAARRSPVVVVERMPTTMPGASGPVSRVVPGRRSSAIVRVVFTRMSAVGAMIMTWSTSS